VERVSYLKTFAAKSNVAEQLSGTPGVIQKENIPCSALPN
jgi:hypothetical protein